MENMKKKERKNEGKKKRHAHIHTQSPPSTKRNNELLVAELKTGGECGVCRAKCGPASWLSFSFFF